jgi:hypothetical protein
MLWLLPQAASGARVALQADDVGVIQNPASADDSRFLMRFELPSALSTARIDYAAVEFRAEVSCRDSTVGLTVYGFLVTTEWSGQTVAWSQGWNTPGGDVDRRVHACMPAAPSDSAVIDFDVTDMVTAWVSGDRENCGLLVAIARGEEGLFEPWCVGRGAVALPTLVVMYSPRKGY